MSQTDAITFLKQMLIEKKAGENERDSFSEYKPDSAAENNEDGSVQMTETRIYVGLNDAKTKEQKFETEKYKSILKKICQSYHVAFSLDIEEGGYFHDDGEYTEETSLILVMINADRKTVRDIGKDLCTFFHQESVLITEDHITGYFINKETLDE